MNTSKLTQILTRRTSVVLNVSERTVEEVMSFHWKTANQATREVASIEISGFGRFDIRPKQVINKLATYERYKLAYENKLANMTPEDKEYNKYTLRLQLVTEDIQFLKEKLNEDQH